MIKIAEGSLFFKYQLPAFRNGVIATTVVSVVLFFLGGRIQIGATPDSLEEARRDALEICNDMVSQLPPGASEEVMAGVVEIIGGLPEFRDWIPPVGASPNEPPPSSAVMRSLIDYCYAQSGSIEAAARQQIDTAAGAIIGSAQRMLDVFTQQSGELSISLLAPVNAAYISDSLLDPLSVPQFFNNLAVYSPETTTIVVGEVTLKGYFAELALHMNAGNGIGVRATYGNQSFYWSPEEMTSMLLRFSTQVDSEASRITSGKAGVLALALIDSQFGESIGVLMRGTALGDKGNLQYNQDACVVTGFLTLVSNASNNLTSVFDGNMQAPEPLNATYLLNVLAAIDRILGEVPSPRGVGAGAIVITPEEAQQLTNGLEGIRQTLSQALLGYDMAVTEAGSVNDPCITVPVTSARIMSPNGNGYTPKKEGGVDMNALSAKLKNAGHGSSPLRGPFN
jgi:hypothetical protein